MESGGSMPHSQGLSDNPYPEQFVSLTHIYLRSFLILCSHLLQCLPIGLFPVGLPVKILKTLITSSFLAT